MANPIKVKNGMSGSRCGKGRRDKTSVLKKASRKLRRRESRDAVRG